MKTKETIGGYTMVEILIAASIMGILAVVAFASFDVLREKAHDTERVNDITQLQLTLRLMKDTDGGYPAYDGGVVIGEGGGLDSELSAYFPEVPHDKSGGVADPTYEYVYDSDETCGGTQRTVLYAKTMERAGNGNWADVCGGTEPGTNTYVVILN